MRQDNQNTSEEWERLKTYARIYAKKAWWKFKKKARKAAFFLGVQLISISGVSAQIVVNDTQGSKEYLARATAVKENPNYREFVKEHKEEIEEREGTFGKDLWQTMTKNISKIQEGAKRGRKTQIVREVNAPYENKKVITKPRFYCASTAISSLYETKGDKYPEYEFMLNCLSNPNYCPTIIEDLNKNYGKKSKTNNVKQTLKENFQKNPRSVCIVIVESKQNSSSGLHFTMAFPESVVEEKGYSGQNDSSFVALDSTIVVHNDSVKGKVASFNVEKISDIESYYTGARNRGYVYNITEMVESDLIVELYEKYSKKKFELKNRKKETVAQLSGKKQEQLWAAVSRLPQSKKVTKTKIEPKVYGAVRKNRSKSKA